MTQQTPQIRAPNWAAIIDDMRDAGLSGHEIGRAMCCQLTDRMISYYAQGVQPLHWRGEAMIALWQATTGRTREMLPMHEIDKGASRIKRRGPFANISWPSLAHEIAPTAAKRRGRPPKNRNGD